MGATATAVSSTDEDNELASVENTGENTDSSELRQSILDMRSNIDEAYWGFAEALHTVWKDTLYLEWGFDDWTDYVEQELDYKLRTAQYLVGIIDWFGKMSKPIQTWVKSLGWTKAKLLVKKVNQDNWKDVRKQIKNKSVTQITTILKGGGTSSTETTGTDSGEKPTRKAFSLHTEQLDNVNAAVAKAMEDASSDKEGHALDLICTSYLSLNPGERDLGSFLSSYEKIFGVKLIAYNEGDDEIVFGEATLDSIVGDDGESSDSESDESGD
jgi:hypothetical protein